MNQRFQLNPCIKPNRLPKNPDREAKGRFPSWLHKKLPKGGELRRVDRLLKKSELHTVCEEAKCPNLFECWSRGTATFLIMGKECTRSCGFCDIDFSATPSPLDPKEADRVATSVRDLHLKHVVLTMVARDDLSDGGADHLSQVLAAVRKKNPKTSVEVLTSDFSGNKNAWDTIAEKKPDVFNHNIETVERLSPKVRHKATYPRTLELLTYMKWKRLFVKSGLMVGLGEREEEVKQTLDDLKHAGCDSVTIGQYLQASRKKLRVHSFVHPDQFTLYEEYALSIGIRQVSSGPFVRSSYHADLFFHSATQ